MSRPCHRQPWQSVRCQKHPGIPESLDGKTSTVAHARVPTGHKTAQKQTRNLRHSNGGVPKNLVARQNRGCRGNPIPTLAKEMAKIPTDWKSRRTSWGIAWAVKGNDGKTAV